MSKLLWPDQGGAARGIAARSLLALAVLAGGFPLASSSSLQLMHDAGHNILGIPWWVWVAGGVVLVAVALLAAPELIALLAPDVGEAMAVAQETALGAQQAAAEAELERQGLSEAVSEVLQNKYAIQDNTELSTGIRAALDAGRTAGEEAWGQAYAQSIAEQAEAAAPTAALINGVSAGVGGVGVFAARLGLSEAPSVFGSGSRAGTGTTPNATTTGTSGSADAPGVNPDDATVSGEASAPASAPTADTSGPAVASGTNPNDPNTWTRSGGVG